MSDPTGRFTSGWPRDGQPPRSPRAARSEGGGPTDAERRLVGERYLLEARIGSGRCGPIYRAVDTTVAEHAPDRYAAVQILWSGLGRHDWLVERFKKEFVRLRSWRHANIVDVLDFGRDGDTYFWATALLEGASLRSITRELAPELLEKDEARAVIRSVGDALEYAHARRKVHGDIRLENVFVTTDVVVKVLDFAPITISRPIRLLADELDAGTLPSADSADDVYGLACLAYELLAGRHPYGGSLPEEALRCGLAPDPIDGLSQRAWQALSRALAQAPEARTATVGEFLSEFETDGGERVAPAIPQIERAAAPHSGWHAPSAIHAMPRMPRAAVRPRRRASRVVWWTAALAGLAGLAYVGYTRLTVGPPVTDLLSAAEQRLQALLSPSAAPPAEGTAGSAPVELAPLPETTLPETTLPEAAMPEAATRADELEPGFEPAGEEASAGLPPDEQDAPGTSPGSPALPATLGEETQAPSPEPANEGEPAAALPAQTATPSPAVSGFEFEQQRVTVTEDSAIAVLVIRRLGEPRGESAVSWWTIDGTATAEEDYASFGARLETFGDGEQRRTIHIPLVVDAIAEPTEYFRVGLAYDSMPDGETIEAEVVIIDDDS